MQSSDTALRVRWTCTNGSFEGRREGAVCSFLGVPYAKAPCGDARFRRPLPLPAQASCQQAQRFGPAPLQKCTGSEPGLEQLGEDCLRLNVWLQESSEPKRPVIVFVHGGSFRFGGTSEPIYDGARFAAENQDVILVTVQSRLSVLGYVDLRALPGGEDFPDVNLGLLDLVCALRFLRDNIGALGGDAERITLMGNSSGAAAVALVMLMECARGLFARAICSSGTVLMTSSWQEHASLSRALMSQAKVSTVQDLLRFSSQQMLALVRELHLFTCFPLRGDGLLPGDPLTALALGQARSCELLIGTNLNEVGFWIPDAGGRRAFERRLLPAFCTVLRKVVPEKARPLLENYLGVVEGMKNGVSGQYAFVNDALFHGPALLSARAQAKHGRVWRYLLTAPSPLDGLGACHLLETALFFGNVSHRLFGEAGAERSLVRRIQRLWVTFAKEGGAGLERLGWPAFTLDEEQSLLIGRQKNTVIRHPLRARMEAVLPLVENVRWNGNFSSFLA